MVVGVQFMHTCGIAHRDLKLSNVVLMHDDTVAKLIDFGVSAEFDPNDPTPLLSDQVGSPLYVAPEVFQGVKYWGPEVDVWSLGICLFVLATGNEFIDPVTYALEGRIEEMLQWSNVALTDELYGRLLSLSLVLSLYHSLSVSLSLTHHP